MSTPAPLRVWEASFALYRPVFRSNLVSSLGQPFLYLLGMGVGVGALVDRGARSAEVLGGVGYLAFVAPALLATTAMTTAAQEATWPVMEGFTWSRRYRAMAATPLAPADLVAGVALWQATRTAISAGGVAAALALFDDTRSPGLLPAVAFAVLTGLAFSLPITAWSSSRSTERSFPALQRFVIIPLFLFAGAFYPVTQLPAWLRPVAYATPLWHGVELCRGAVLGTLALGEAALHVAVLAVVAAGGFGVCRTTFARRLAR
jgi:lipooligosaccharide transport system permease protein